MGVRVHPSILSTVGSMKSKASGFGSRNSPVVDQTPRARHHCPPLTVPVVTVDVRAGGVHPHGLVERLVDLTVVFVEYVLPDVHRVVPVFEQVLEALDDVVDVFLAENIMAGTVIRGRVGSCGHEQVGKSGHLDPEVRTRIVTVLPQVGKCAPVPPTDVDRRGELQLESCRQDDDVRRDESAFGGDHTVRGHSLERCPMEGHVFTRERLEEAGILDDPLTVRTEVRSQLLDQIRAVREAGLQVVPCRLEHHLVGRRGGEMRLRPFRVDPRQRVQVVGREPVGAKPEPLVVARNMSERPLLSVRNVVHDGFLRHDPVR